MLNISMNLDLLFNSSKANKGLNNTNGAISTLVETSKLLKDNFDKIDTGIGVSFGKLDTVLDMAGDKFGTLSNGMLALNEGIPNSDLLIKPTEYLEAYRKEQIKVIAGNAKVGASFAGFAATAMMTERLHDSNDVVEGLANSFEKFGMKLGDTETLQFRMLDASVRNNKAFKQFNSVLNDGEKSLKGLQDGMNETQIAKYSELMSRIPNAMREGGDSIKYATAEMKAFNNATYATNVVLPGLKKSFRDMSSFVVTSFGSTLGVLRVLEDSFTTQKNTVATIHQLGLKNNKTFSEGAGGVASFWKTNLAMGDSISRVARGTSVTLTEASDAYKALAESRIGGSAKDLEKLTVRSVRLGQAFGMSEGQVADMFKTLSLSGGIKTDGIESITEEMAKVQAQFGMTNAEATEAGSAIASMAAQMAKGGKVTAKNAKIIGREVSKMTVTFTMAGLAASDATAMLDRFMDPSKLEDNIYLWHRMGLSAADGLAMMSGDMNAMDGMSDKLGKTAFDLQKRWKDQPLALAAMAEAMGMNVKQVNQLSGAYEKKIAMTDADIAAQAQQATLESQAAQARSSALSSLKQLANAGNALMASFILPLLNIITPIIVKIAQWGTALLTLGDNMEGWKGKAISIFKAAGGAVLMFTLLTKGQLLSMLNPMNLVNGGFTKMFTSMSGGAAKAGKGLLGFFTKVGTGMAGMTTSLASGTSVSSKLFKRFGASTSHITKGFDKAKKGMSGFFTGFKKSTESSLGSMGKFKDSLGGLKDKLTPGKVPEIPPIKNHKAGELRSSLFSMDNDKTSSPASKVKDIKEPKGPSKFMESVGKMPAKQLMQIGAAMALLAASVFLLALSFKMLVSSIDEAKPGTMGKALGTLAGMMIAVGIAAAVLGKVGLSAGSGILYLAGGIALLAVSVAILVGSFLLLSKAVAGMSWKSIGKVGAVMGGLVIILIGLAVALSVAGPAFIGAGVALALFGLGLTAVGLGVAAIGGGMMLVVKAVESLGKSFIENSKTISQGMFNMLGAISALGAVGLIAGPGLLFVGGAIALVGLGAVLAGTGLKLMSSALEGLAKIENISKLLSDVNIGLWNIGETSWAAFIPILLMGTGMALLGVGMMGVGFGVKLLAEGLEKLGEISWVSLGKFGALAAAIVGLGFAGNVAAFGMLAVGAAFILIGGGLSLAGLGVNLLAAGFSKLADNGSTIIPTALKMAAAIGILTVALTALGLAAPLVAIGLGVLVGASVALGLAALVFAGLGKSFQMMGRGVQVLSENASGAVAGIISLKSQLKGFKGAASEFNEEIKLLNDSFKSLTDNANMSIQSLQKVESSVTVEKSETEGQLKLYEHVTRIADNTDEMVTLLKEIRDKKQTSSSTNNDFNTIVGSN